MNFEIAIHQFQDPRVGITYGFLLHLPEHNRTLGVDAGQAEPVLELLEQKGWRLDELWITHHHFDHTAGLLEVKQKTGCRVTGPKHPTQPIAGLDRLVEEGDPLTFCGHRATILHAPGHTQDMLNYYFADWGICFVGDVIFPLGCGRLLEGSAEDMWSSLQKLLRLPNPTQLFSCHEYAESNARFALSIEPNHPAINACREAFSRRIASGNPTVPSILQTEREANPFLRPHDPQLKAALHLGPEVPDVEVFAKLRAMKDQF